MPLAAAKAETWVWKRRWKAALLVANIDPSSAAVEFSTCLEAAGVALVAMSLFA